MQVSASAGFNHINTYVHPQATFIDNSGEEEPFMFSGFKTRAVSLGRTIIELPVNSEENLMWLTLLDSASLSGKHSHLIFFGHTNINKPGIKLVSTLLFTLSQPLRAP